MSRRVAVIDDHGNVTNVVLVPDDWEPGDQRWSPPGGQKSEVLEDRSLVGPGWGFDSDHPARFGRPFSEDMLEPDEDGEVRMPNSPVFLNGKLYDPDENDWPPSGPPEGKGWSDERRRS
jgi:hypothetical protein